MQSCARTSSEPFEKASIASTSLVKAQRGRVNPWRTAAGFANTGAQNYMLVLVLEMEKIVPSNRATGTFPFQVDCPLILMMLFVLNP